MSPGTAPIAPTPPITPPSPAPLAAPTYTHAGQRYVLGYGATDYGIWDRYAPSSPQQRFPRSDEGWRAAWTAFAALEPDAMPVSSSSAPTFAEPQAGPTPPIPPAFAPGPKTNGMAVASLVTSLIFIPIIPIVLGHIAKRDIDRSNGEQSGRGMAIAGITIGWTTLGIIILSIAAVAAFFGAFGDEVMDALEQDADARSMLDNAVVQANAYRDETGSFLGASPDTLDPSTEWNTLGFPVDGEVSVRDVGSDRILLVTRTNLGMDYCAAIDGSFVNRGNENAQTVEDCDGGWVFDFEAPD